jgi:hypothetical protein
MAPETGGKPATVMLYDIGAYDVLYAHVAATSRVSPMHQGKPLAVIHTSNNAESVPLLPTWKGPRDSFPSRCTVEVDIDTGLICIDRS